MIVVKIEDYCKNCPDFEADQLTTKYEKIDGTCCADHILSCSNADKCDGILKHLKANIK